MLTAKSPPATRVKATTGTTIFRLKAEAAVPSLVASAFRRKIPHSTGAAKSGAIVGFENVAIPSRIAATRSLRGVNNHAVPRGERSGAATSL